MVVSTPPPAQASAVGTQETPPEIAPPVRDPSERARALDETHTAVGHFMTKLSWDAHTRTLAFDRLRTEVTIAAARKRARFELGDVEWHANRVGARWKQAREIVCPRCVERGYTLGSLDFFDGHLASFDVSADLPGAALPADELCVALRERVLRVPDVDVGPCSCEGGAIKSDLSDFSLPGPRRPEPPCDERARSGFVFSVGASATSGWGEIRGAAGARDGRGWITLSLSGASRSKMLVALRGAMR